MILLLAIFGFASLLIALAFLLMDFSHFVMAKTKGTIWPQHFVDFGPYLITLLVALMFSILGLLFYKFGVILVSYLLSSELISFYRLLRGVFSLASDVQNPFELKHFMSGMILGTALQFLAVWLIYRSMRKFMVFVNQKYNHVSYTESDLVYFGFLASFLFILLEITLYSQNIPFVSEVAHLTYLSLSKVSVLVFFLSVAHIGQLGNNQYRSSLERYIQMSNITKAIVFSPIRIVLVTYGVALILHLPFFTGTQFGSNNLVVFAVCVITCGLSFFVLRLVFSQVFNYLGVVMIAEGEIEVSSHIGEDYSRIKRSFLYAVCGIGGVFVLIKTKLFFFLLVIFSGISLVFLFLVAFFYSAGLGFSLVRSNRLKHTLPEIAWKAILRYIRVVIEAFLRPSQIMLGFILLVFILISFCPKPFQHEGEGYTNSIFDEAGNVVYYDKEGDNPCIPISREQVPPFLVKCLFLQEDRGFLEQDDWLPNQSNWHGFSFAMVYRFFSGGGGSNLNQQLTKNLAHKGTNPQDIQRKFAEVVTSYQMSLQSDKQDLIVDYLNAVSFNGGVGHRGIMSASLTTFGRPTNQLNPLEMMYMVATLKRASSLKVKSGYVNYNKAMLHVPEIKEKLLSFATKWFEQGLITKSELNMLKNQDLDFSTKSSFKSGIAASTKVFFDKELQKIGAHGVTSITTISKLNQLKVNHVVQKFKGEFRKYNHSEMYELFCSCIVVDVSTGEIIAHYGGSGAVDRCNFETGYSVGSLIKPFILLQLLEDGWRLEEIKLFDGEMKGKFTPNNYNGRYSDTRMGINEILGSSPNAPVVNVRELTDPIQLFQRVENQFSNMKIPSDSYYDLKDKNRRGEFEVNYPMGSRSMPVFYLAQAYQALLNNGEYRNLTAFKSMYDPMLKETKLFEQEVIQVYKPENANSIKSALSYTMKPGGTGFHLGRLLPPTETYFAKTATTDGAKHGYTVLSDGQTLVVTWVSYCKNVNGQLDCNDPIAIPGESGGRSAGVLAARVFSELQTE